MGICTQMICHGDRSTLKKRFVRSWGSLGNNKQDDWGYTNSWECETAIPGRLQIGFKN